MARDRPQAPAENEAAERATARSATERLTFFSDAVVAIAITLLAIDLPVPSGDTAQEIGASLSEHGFEYLTFLISFAVIGAHWTSHHHVFRYVARSDGRIVQLALGWLLIIVLTPFLTKAISEGNLNLLRFGGYAAAQALQLIVFSAIMFVLARNGWFLPEAPPHLAGRGGYRPPLYAALGFLVSIPVYPLVGAWAFALWGLVPWLIGSVRRAAARRRRARAGSAEEPRTP